MPRDMVSIVVSSKDPLLAALFNLPRVTYQTGTVQLNEGSNNQILGYTVDAKGYIDFPVLGAIQVKGLTRKQLSMMIKERLIADDLLRDPVVTVDFMNLKISILGEVKSPGKYSIDRDQINILEAISMAGDLTIYGKREKVLVLREENGQQRAYRVNLCSADHLYTSPVYYLQQNDVIYVEPNATRDRQSTVNGNNVHSTSFWVSLASLLTTITVLFVK